MPYELALGHLLKRVLRGEPALAVEGRPQDGEAPQRVSLLGLSDDDRRQFRRLPIPEPSGGRAATGSVDLTAIRLPELVRADPRWTMASGGSYSYVELGALDAVACQRLLAPVMSQLALILRLRAGEGPKKERGRVDRLKRCRNAHRALGFDARLIEPLLDADLAAEEVIAARSALIQSWAATPDDIGERAIALLCAELAGAYYGKARKDGRIEAARVLTQTTTPLLEATLGEWATLVDYLGEELADADAAPVEVPDVALPPEAPPPVAERIAALRDWWEMYDARHAAQKAGDPSLWGLVPSRWDYGLEGDDRRGAAESLARRALPDQLAASIDSLWGWQVLDRYPQTLVRQPRPLGTFAEILLPAATFWDELALTAWSLCFGPYARHSLDELEEHQREVWRELAQLGAPVDESLYAELIEVGRGHSWLFEPQGLGISISISFDEETGDLDISEPERGGGGGHPGAPNVFVALRDVISRHRRRWIDSSLDAMLEALWRRDLETAAASYWQRYRGRGKPPTLKQALPDIGAAAKRWFGSDHGELARLLRLDGPVTESPTRSPRLIPDDLPSLQAEVAEELARRGTATEDVRRRAWDLRRIASISGQVLVAWQAAGEAPPRSSVMPTAYKTVVDEVFKCALDTAYDYVLRATGEALARRGHPAAADLIGEQEALPSASEHHPKASGPAEVLLEGDELVAAVGESPLPRCLASVLRSSR
jgi:hypothetical protein